jgi:SAM-dependent methyltransferase
MEITSQQFENIQAYLRLAKSSPGFECESRFNRKTMTIQKEEFSRVFSYVLDTSSGFTTLGETQTLDISIPNEQHWEGYRYHLGGGKSGVMQYCKTGILPPHGPANSCDRKYRVEDHAPILLDEYHIKIDLKHEEIQEDPAVIDSFRRAIMSENSLKFYRYKKRYSYSKGSFRVDLTIVKESKMPSRNFAQSGVLQSILDIFDIEVEYISNKNEDDSEAISVGGADPSSSSSSSSSSSTKNKNKQTSVPIEYAVQEWFVILGNILRSLSQKHIIMKVSEMNDVLKSFVRYATGRSLPSSVDAAAIRKDPRRYEMKAPKPVTLEKVNALSPTETSVTIRSGYTVTEKADGLRYLLFITENGRGYLIDNAMDITYTGIMFENKPCILDGELLREGSAGTPMFQYMVFDIYLYEGRNVMNLPLVSASASASVSGSVSASVSGSVSASASASASVSGSNEDTRLGLAAKVLKSTAMTRLQDIKLNIVLKEFLVGSPDNDISIFKCAKQILNKIDSRILLYDTDGLIFTPIGPAMSGKQFKWKPASERTFDLRVKYTSGTNRITVQGKDFTYRMASLTVTAANESTLNPLLVLQGKSQPSAIGRSEAVFATCYLPLESDTSNRVLTTKTKDSIANNAIVEFCYDIEQPNEMLRWIPKIIRHDKVVPNYIDTAKSVLNSIVMPLTPEMIMGLEPIEMDGAIDETYYQGQIENRETATMKPMFDFHNTWVKRMHLLNRFKGTNTRLFDIGVGRGADIDKWIEAGYTYVVGIDKASEGIYSAKDGAYKRYSDYIKTGRLDSSKNSMVFMSMDAEQVWTPNYIKSLTPNENKYLAEVIFGTIPEKKVTENHLRPFYGMATKKGGFNVVSCQFAVHYFFKNLRTLDNLCENLKSIIAPGGYFIGTCFDAYLVNNLLLNLPKGDGISRTDSSGKIQWKITKEYEDYTRSNPMESIGKCINVFVRSIGRAFDEYLVDFDLMTMQLAQIGLHPLSESECVQVGLKASSGTFKELHEDLVNYVNDRKNKAPTRALLNAAKNMDVHQCEFSFLNRWFVFKRL